MSLHPAATHRSCVLGQFRADLGHCLGSAVGGRGPTLLASPWGCDVGGFHLERPLGSGSARSGTRSGAHTKFVVGERNPKLRHSELQMGSFRVRCTNRCKALLLSTPTWLQCWTWGYSADATWERCQTVAAQHSELLRLTRYLRGKHSASKAALE